MYNPHSYFTYSHRNYLCSICLEVLLASGWSNSSILDIFPPTRLLPLCFRLGSFFPFKHFCPNSLASSKLPVGEFFPVWAFFPQSACFLFASGWGVSSRLDIFPPIRLLPRSFRLGLFFLFGHFPPIRLLPQSTKTISGVYKEIL